MKINSLTTEEGKAIKGNDIESAYLGGGCFWCTEAVFQRLKGVVSVVPGYAGGGTLDPTYDEVSSGQTGHAEVIEVKYDSSKISYEILLSVFFASHDPTTLNRQGADTGTQYRSIILTANDTQKEIAEKFIKELTQEKYFDKPIVTEVKELVKFYPAETYHKDYFQKNSEAPYCQVIIAPKIDKLVAKFKHLLAN